MIIEREKRDDLDQKKILYKYIYTMQERILVYTKIKYTLGILSKRKCTRKRHMNKRYEENLWFNIGLNNYNRPPN